ncbi:MAG: hypothetical protein ACTSX7_07190 [Alphaproteobacteria bacterium]
MRHLFAGMVGIALLAACTGSPRTSGEFATIVISPDMTNQFLLSHLDDSQITDPVLQQVVRAMRQDDFFRLTLEKASCGISAAQYWAGFDNQFNIALEGDPVTAHMWYALAASQGHITAKRALTHLAGQMTANEVAQAKYRAAHWRPAIC